MKPEYYCDSCEKFVVPDLGEVSDLDFIPEEDYNYAEYVCPNCDTILLVERRLKWQRK